MMSLEDAQKKLKNRKHFHTGLVRRGWYPPKLQSRICTRPFLK